MKADELGGSGLDGAVEGEQLYREMLSTHRSCYWRSNRNSGGQCRA